ncbi:MAG TPA: acyltransferase, partial [Flavobacteriales bacterium]|nr:acyltransferase [Flavobacteriales bacterium]
MNNHLSDKIRIISLITMVLLTYVHAYTFPSNLFAGEAWSLEGLNFALQYTISQGLARFRIPFFFILSGYFYF